MIITIIVCVLIIGVFVFFYTILAKLKNASNDILSVTELGDPFLGMDSTPLKHIKESYQNTINEGKSNFPSSEFFSESSVSHAYNANTKILDAASGMLVGLGLFGTFLGLTIGIATFDSSNTENIQASIQSLLSGMGTAFATSLLGMLGSLIFTYLDKSVRHKFQKNLHVLTEVIDNKYYIDDVALITMKLSNAIEKNNSHLTEIIEKNNDNLVKVIENNNNSLTQVIVSNNDHLIQEITNNSKTQADIISTNIVDSVTGIKKMLSYTDDEGEHIIANAVREIVTENRQQTKALKSFSTDLSTSLINMFDEVMANQMSEKLQPLLEAMSLTTSTIITHIDQLGEKVASPANEMIGNVAEELKTSMAKVIEEFKSSMSGAASSELQTLSTTLGVATRAMGDFPNTMQSITSTLQNTIEEVRNAVADMSSTTASSNNTAMKQMQEQITFATTSINSAITEVKEVMASMTRSSEQSSNEMVQKLTAASEAIGMHMEQSSRRMVDQLNSVSTEVGALLNTTMADVSASVKNSIKSITDDVVAKQTAQQELQELTMDEGRKLLSLFNTSVSRLEETNKAISATMSMFTQAQGYITSGTAHLQTISNNLQSATETFQKSQAEYANKMNELQKKSQEGIDAVTELINESSDASEEYVRQFESIKQGLSSIFNQMKQGLSEYSATVEHTTKKYLDNYSTALTNTTDALAATINQQSEVADTLAEAINKIRR